MSEIRLQKIIAQAGIASRREAERLIAQGLVTVNGRVVTALGSKADPAADAVKVNGKLVTRREAPVYLVMNKPRNVLTAMRPDAGEEGEGRPTVADLLPPGRRRVFPVGRLDFDAEGALLLTNDGELAHRLAHPRYRVPRVYEAKVRGVPSERALARLADGTWSRPAPAGEARVRLLDRRTESNAWLQIELREGRHHQVKRMCEAVGHPVLKLVRRSFGRVSARGLAAGALRPLTPGELERLRELAGLARAKREKAGPARAGWAKAKSAGGPSRAQRGRRGR